MDLGKTLWKLKVTDDEKLRISAELRKDDSSSLRVFNEHHRHNTLFNEVCKKLLRTITGFRPKSNIYRGRVTQEVLGALKENRARNDYWNLYLCSVASYVNEELPALNQLLEETKVDSEFEINSENVLSRISELASEFSVNDKEFSSLYKLWPFTRTDNIDHYLSGCTKFDRFKALEQSLRGIEKKLEKSINHQVEDLSEELNHLKLDFARKGVRKKDLKDSLKNVSVEFDTAIESIQQDLGGIRNEVARIEKFVRRVDSRRSSEFSQAILETKSHVKSFNEDIDKLKAVQRQLELELDSFSEQRNDSFSDDKPVGVESQSLNQPLDLGSAFTLLRTDDSYTSGSVISVEVALERFQSACRSQEENNEYIKAFFYMVLASKCVVVNNRTSFALWRKATGWDRSSGFTCASVMSVDESFLAEHLNWLLSEPSKPRVLEILDFDVGFTNGYLVPFLKAWGNSAQNYPWKKIALFPSNESWTVDPGLDSFASILPQIQSGFSDDLEISSSQDFISPEGTVRFLECLASADFSQGNSDVGTKQKFAELLQTAQALPHLSQMDLISKLPTSSEMKENLSSMIKSYWERKLT